jgi:DNA-binding response OmpR family regulator
MSTTKKIARDDQRILQCRTAKNPAHEATIFIIDDEDIVIETIKHYLSKDGFKNMHGFTVSTEAIEMLRFVRPDVILTDIVMPDVSGNFLTKLVRTFEHLENVPVLVVTSDSDPDTRANVLRLGANQVLTKPLKGSELVEEVTRAIQDSRAAIAEKDLERDESTRETKAQARTIEEKLRRQMGRDV